MILNILVILGVISMIVGVVLAMFQWDYKRMLAYSSISQVGYIILSIGLGTPLGIIAGLFHLVNHSVFKTLMFLTSGSVEYATGLRDMRKMGGLKEKMPVTATTSFIGSMSISGVPPFSGFWSKLVIILACIQAGRIWLGLIAALISILTLSTFLKIQKYVFGGKINPDLQQVKEVPVWMKLPMIILSVLCILMGALILPGIRPYFLEPAAKVLYNGFGYSQSIFPPIDKDVSNNESSASKPSGQKSRPAISSYSVSKSSYDVIKTPAVYRATATLNGLNGK